MVFNRNFLECLQLDISSFLLFSVAISVLQIIKYFSHKHKLHLLLILEYDRACFTFRHLMLYKIFLSFRFQTYLLNSVACLYRSFLNEHTWFLYLKRCTDRKDQCMSLLKLMSWLWLGKSGFGHCIFRPWGTCLSFGSYNCYHWWDQIY